MNVCTNHPDKVTDFVCHHCGRAYCSECLSEYGDFYYCFDDECRNTARQNSKAEPEENQEQESNPEFSPGVVICPYCSVILELTEEEQKARWIKCPGCNSEINLELVHKGYKEEKNYKEIFTSVNQGDIAIIKSLFAEGDIDYYILGENFLSLSPLLQPARIFVLDSQIEEVKAILKNFEPHIFGVSSKDYDDSETE